MNAFRNVFDGIVNNWHSESQSSDIKMSEFDFILETGDISQNGRRRPEYYWYFNSLQGYNKTKPIMTTMGENYAPLDSNIYSKFLELLETPKVD